MKFSLDYAIYTTIPCIVKFGMKNYTETICNFFSASFHQIAIFFFQLISHLKSISLLHYIHCNLQGTNCTLPHCFHFQTIQQWMEIVTLYYCIFCPSLLYLAFIFPLWSSLWLLKSIPKCFQLVLFSLHQYPHHLHFLFLAFLEECNTSWYKHLYKYIP